MNDRLKKILSGVGVLAAFGLGGAAIAGAQGDAPAGASAVSQSQTAQAPGNEASEQNERSEAGETDEQVTGADADRAGQAALKSVGSGKILQVERETPDQDADRPEPGDTPDSAAEHAMEQRTAYSVEVQKSDGSTVEVALDASFNALGTEQDDSHGEQDSESASEVGEAAE